MYNHVLIKKIGNHKIMASYHILTPTLISYEGHNRILLELMKFTIFSSSSKRWGWIAYKRFCDHISMIIMVFMSHMHNGGHVGLGEGHTYCYVPVHAHKRHGSPRQ